MLGWFKKKFYANFKEDGPPIIDQGIQLFTKEYKIRINATEQSDKAIQTLVEPLLPELQRRLKKDAKRVFIFTKPSITEDRFSRAFYTFCGGILISVGIVTSLLYYFTPDANPLMFIPPIVSSLIASCALIVTSRGSIMRRAKGGMESVVDDYFDYLEEKEVLIPKNHLSLEEKPENTQAAIMKQLQCPLLAPRSNPLYLQAYPAVYTPLYEVKTEQNLSSTPRQEQEAVDSYFVINFSPS